jgi:hypothetical protein
MKLYLVMVGNECKAAHTTQKAAREAAKWLRMSYWPEIIISEVNLGRCRIVKRMKEIPHED